MVYSAVVRPELRREYSTRENETDLADTVKRINKTAAEILPTVADKYEVEECTLPWDRLFEIGISIKEK